MDTKPLKLAHMCNVYAHFAKFLQSQYIKKASEILKLLYCTRTQKYAEARGRVFLFFLRKILRYFYVRGTGYGTVPGYTGTRTVEFLFFGHGPRRFRLFSDPHST